MSHPVWITAFAIVLGAPVAGAQTPAPPPAQPTPQAAPAPTEVDTRYALAKRLVKEGQPEKAAEEYAWLWENTLKVDPAKAEIRATFMASEMERLASQNPAAKSRFVLVRDDAEKRLKDAPALNAPLVDDALLLNRIVGEPERTLAWFDGVKADAPRAKQLPGLSVRVEQLLEARGRWTDLSTYCYPNPKAIAKDEGEAFRSAVLAAAKAPEGQRDMLNQTVERSHCNRMSRLYASLLVAKRDTDAAETLDVIASTDTFGRTVLACITKALELNEAREEMRKPLDVAWKKGAGIKVAREKLTKALKK